MRALLGLFMQEAACPGHEIIGAGQEGGVGALGEGGNLRTGDQRGQSVGTQTNIGNASGPVFSGNFPGTINFGK